MSATKQCEIVAVVKDRKNQGVRALTDAYQTFQKSGLFEGRTRTYTPNEDEGDRYPSERSIPQENVDHILNALGIDLIRMIDTIRTQDEGNTVARADIVVPDGPTFTDVPATHLLWLEKFCGDVLTCVKAIPELDPSIEWERDPNTGQNKSASPVETVKTQKRPQVLMKAPATEKHAAQTEVYNLDVPVGTYTDTRFSTALPSSQKQALVGRVEKLRDAVRIARERANATEVDNFRSGEDLMKYIFEG